MGRCKNEDWRGRQASPSGKDSHREQLRLIPGIVGSENLWRKIHLTLVASTGNKLHKMIWKGLITECYAFLFKILSLLLSHLVYARTYEEVKTSIYSEGLFYK